MMGKKIKLTEEQAKIFETTIQDIYGISRGELLNLCRKNGIEIGNNDETTLRNKLIGKLKLAEKPKDELNKDLQELINKIKKTDKLINESYQFYKTQTERELFEEDNESSFSNDAGNVFPDKAEKIIGIENAWDGSPQDVPSTMKKMANALGMIDYEAFREDDVFVDHFWGNVIALFVNMGDSPTVIFDTRSNEFIIDTFSEWYSNNSEFINDPGTYMAEEVEMDNLNEKRVVIAEVVIKMIMDGSDDIEADRSRAWELIQDDLNNNLEVSSGTVEKVHFKRDHRNLIDPYY